MKRPFVALFFIFCVFAGIVAFLFIHSKGISLQKQSTRQDSQKQSTVIGLPMQLAIPSIRLTAAVESVGLDASGRMDVPREWNDVAWYKLGVRPGEIGNAVIDGHVDTTTGAPAVFANLKSLHVGDIMIVTDANRKQYTFIISRVASFSDAHFPLDEVFGNASVSRLNLITCDGVWDPVAKNYDKRLVVFSQLKK